MIKGYTNELFHYTAGLFQANSKALSDANGLEISMRRSLDALAHTFDPLVDGGGIGAGKRPHLLSKILLS